MKVATKLAFGLYLKRLSDMKETRFKDTEVGRIPEDWTLIPIRELAKDMADGPFGSNLKTEHYTIDKQVRIIQLGNIGDCGWLDDNTKYTTYEHAKTLSRCIATPGSILVAKMMPAGRSVVCPSEEKQLRWRKPKIPIPKSKSTISPEGGREVIG